MTTLEEKLLAISSRRSSKFTKNNVLTYDFSTVLEEFFKENFDMYVTVERIGNHLGHMRILSEQAFVLLRSFMLAVLGRHTVKLRLYTDDESYVMELHSHGIRDMDLKERSHFIRLAHSAGFDIRIYDDYFKLYTPYQKSDPMRVHAINVPKLMLKRDMEAMFFLD